jgi:hypothetical protein
MTTHSHCAWTNEGGHVTALASDQCSACLRSRAEYHCDHKQQIGELVCFRNHSRATATHPLDPSHEAPRRAMV